MGKMQRTKGAAFEREISHLIFESLGIKTKRNLEQYQQSNGFDLEGLPAWAIECKRYAAAGYGDKRSWWGQAASQAAAAGREPVVIYKLDRLPIRCLVAPFNQFFDLTDFDGVADISFECWCALVRETLD